MVMPTGILLRENIMTKSTIESVARKAHDKLVTYDELAARVIEMIRDPEDRYGIGNFTSQWTSDDIAEDIIERLNKEFSK